MILKELREKWEKGFEVILCVASPYKELLVVVHKLKPINSLREEYDVLRYFRIGQEWEISRDVNAEEHLEICLEYVNNWFKEFIPK